MQLTNRQQHVPKMIICKLYTVASQNTDRCDLSRLEFIHYNHLYIYVIKIDHYNIKLYNRYHEAPCNVLLAIVRPFTSNQFTTGDPTRGETLQTT